MTKKLGFDSGQVQEFPFFLKGPAGTVTPTHLLFFIVQRVYTVCTRINYKIVLVTNFNKYLHYGTSGTEYVYKHRCK